MRFIRALATASVLLTATRQAGAQAAPAATPDSAHDSSATSIDSGRTYRRFPGRDNVGIATPVLPQERRAIEHDDAYYTRLTIHRWGSYAMLPLFAGEYLLGRRLLNGGDVPGWMRNTHGTVAGAIGVLFAANTVTGAMNLWESRHDGEGGARRLLHSALMLSADAGFLYTASLAEDDGGSRDFTRHRDAALTSIGLSAAGTALMWFWRN